MEAIPPPRGRRIIVRPARDAQATTVYRTMAKHLPNSPRLIVEKMCVGVADRLPRRMIMKAQNRNHPWTVRKISVKTGHRTRKLIIQKYLKMSVKSVKTAGQVLIGPRMEHQ